MPLVSVCFPKQTFIETWLSCMVLLISSMLFSCPKAVLIQCSILLTYRRDRLETKWKREKVSKLGQRMLMQVIPLSSTFQEEGQVMELVHSRQWASVPRLGPVRLSGDEAWNTSTNPSLLSVISSKEPRDPEQLYSTLKTILQQVKVGVSFIHALL